MFVYALLEKSVHMVKGTWDATVLMVSSDPEVVRVEASRLNTLMIETAKKEVTADSVYKTYSCMRCITDDTLG